MINILCFGGAAGAALFSLWIMTQAMFGKDGWYALPNAFNWIIERTYGRRRWKAELETKGLAQRIAWLENCSRQWEELRAQGREPMYSDTLGWVACADVCPCGYLTECAIWCGDGHRRGGWVFATDGTGWQLQKGQCDHDLESEHVLGLIDEVGRPVMNAYKIRPVMWDVKGAGGKYER